MALAAAATTKTGHGIALAVQHFLLFYAGVFALVALTASVAAGLAAADRVIMTAGGRIAAQAAHRAASFAAVAFLAVHITVEVLAGRSRAADAVVPFLDHGRTFYLGLGTVASDLLVLIVVTGLLRGRFAAVRPAWLWRALHAVAYLCWPLAIVHGLLAGRTAKPYVDWSYGACVALGGARPGVPVRRGAAGRRDHGRLRRHGPRGNPRPGGPARCGPGSGRGDSRCRAPRSGVSGSGVSGSGRARARLRARRGRRVGAACAARPGRRCPARPRRARPRQVRLRTWLPRSRLPAGSGYPAPGRPGSEPGYPDSGYPGSGYPGSGYPGSGYPGSGYPGSGYPGSGWPGHDEPAPAPCPGDGGR